MSTQKQPSSTVNKKGAPLFKNGECERSCERGPPRIDGNFLIKHFK